MKNSFRSLLGGAATLALVGASVPAYATTTGTTGDPVSDTCIINGPKAEHQTDQSCVALKKFAEENGMGKADGAGTAQEPGVTNVYRLSTYLFSQHFEKGWLVYSMDTGAVHPMSDEVYDFWTNPQNSDFSREIFRIGLPADYRMDLSKDSAHPGSGITTVFDNGMNDHRFYLRFDPVKNRVMDYAENFSGKDLSWSDSITIDGPFSSHADLVSTGLKDAGYEPHDAGYIETSLASFPSFNNLASLMEKHLIALPEGTPWVVNVETTQLDATSKADREDTLENARFVAQQLHQVYPNSHIVFHGVLTADDETEINTFNAQMKQAVTEEGASFVDTSGWVTRYNLKPYMQSDSHILNETGVQKVSYQMKWAIRHAIGQ